MKEVNRRIFYMEIYDLKIELNTAFDLGATLECGQCFRWSKNEESVYSGVVCESYVEIKQELKALNIKSTKVLDESFWNGYLGLDEPYDDFQVKFSKDKYIKEAVAHTPGLRVMKQMPWETLISFILSSNNNIKRISGSIEKLSEKYGTEIETWDGKIAYAFPTLDQLVGVSAEEFKALGVGYRDKYLVDAVEKLHNKEVDLKDVEDMEYKAAKKELMKIKGIGSKVADCVLLYGFDFKEAFPVDVWVKRIMMHCYGEEIEHEKNILNFVEVEFGELAGIAQQYLFHYARTALKW
jgi:N-glycosylase/DNA lyase